MGFLLTEYQSRQMQEAGLSETRVRACRGMSRRTPTTDKPSPIANPFSIQNPLLCVRGRPVRWHRNQSPGGPRQSKKGSVLHRTSTERAPLKPVRVHSTLGLDKCTLCPPHFAFEQAVPRSICCPYQA